MCMLLVGLSSLLQELGRAYQALAAYDCNKAIELFSNLPAKHYNTGWVLIQLARAHFELCQYQKVGGKGTNDRYRLVMQAHVVRPKVSMSSLSRRSVHLADGQWAVMLYVRAVFQCERVFEEVRRLYAHSLHGMEIYSTALWHLQREVQLSTLAQQLTDLSQRCPQTWCAMGNCFSLQKEHDAAISYLQRAVQVDPDFAYAYTLLGHEYALTEELEKAMSCFRNAVRVDPRHYNAW